MSTINASQIYQKVKEYSKSNEGKKVMDDKIKEYKKQGVRKTGAGDTILTNEVMHQIAYELIRDLQDMATNLEMMRVLPHSVAAHFDSLQAQVISDTPDGGCTIAIWFADDLHRESLFNYSSNGAQRHTGSGISNIISLFDTGYNAGGSVYGYWENAGIYTWSLDRRPNLGFMQGEIDRFNAKYKRSVCHAELMW